MEGNVYLSIIATFKLPKIIKALINSAFKC